MKPIKTISILAATAAALLLAGGVAWAETDAQKIQRLERELADLRAHVGPVIPTMSGTPLAELKAVAGILAPETRGLAIDLSGKSGEYCLRDPQGGRFMVHFSERPTETPEDVLYFVAADSLTGAGLDVSKMPPLPTELGKMTPRQWYYYSGDYVEPHHRGKLGREYLVLALDIR
ncbi:MAG: hypothetical protein OEY97_11300 [Nitrospirota bacterium]|nr:hypothetical protein [Nitrospirota bacterium]